MACEADGTQPLELHATTTSNTTPRIEPIYSKGTDSDLQKIDNQNHDQNHDEHANEGRVNPNSPTSAAIETYPLISAIFDEVTSIVVVISADTIDSIPFTEDPILQPVIYQTKVAAEFYNQALDLQGQLTGHQALSHLLELHPKGLIPALYEMKDAFNQGMQWKSITKVKFHADQVPIVPTSEISDLLPEQELGSQLEDQEEEALVVKEPDEGFLWHEVLAKPFVDPGTGKRLVIIQQNDVTSYFTQLAHLSKSLDLAAKYGNLSEKQMALISSTFPRHILEHFLKTIDHQSEASRLVETTMSEGLLQQLPPSETTDPSSGFVNNYLQGSNHLARIPTKGFEKLARSHLDVTILFMDIVGFTTMSKQVNPGAVMNFLNELFSQFDRLTDMYGVQKIETAGDCYVAATGILKDDNEGFSVIRECGDATRNAVRMMQMAKAMLIVSKRVRMPHNGEPVTIRIGLHTGDCVTGLVGSKLPKFSVFGDTMNTASRMESTCTPGQIHISESTSKLLKHVDQWRATGGVEIKGKGTINTYYWDQEENDEEPSISISKITCQIPSIRGTRV